MATQAPRRICGPGGVRRAGEPPLGVNRGARSGLPPGLPRRAIVPPEPVSSPGRRGTKGARPLVNDGRTRGFRALSIIFVTTATTAVLAAAPSAADPSVGN